MLLLVFISEEMVRENETTDKNKGGKIMNKSKETQIFENRADSTGEYADSHCENCNESLVFAMRDNYHTFSIGMKTVIECLRTAEHEGAIPPLPAEWWTTVDCEN
ncbi:hypothetical protein FACS1894120_4900 [Clostridia bacterium]|nr:hypothetical protein FACS1894120_4900 [Clostridia bacterium]